MRILSKIGATSAALTIMAIAGFVIYIIAHDEIEKAIYAIQHPETIKGSLADTPLGQNNPIDRALGGGLFTLPHLKTNVGYSYYFGRMEEEHE